MIGAKMKMMKKPLKISTNIKYNELKQYKKRFENKEIDEIACQIYLDGLPFSATLKYGLVPARLKYDRRYKCKIYLDGITSKKNQIEVIKKLHEINPSEPLLMVEILFAKEREELIEHDDGKLEYHFTFLQY